ncbi:polyprenyl diphosphate synthase [Lentzea sp. NPDC034063]|uniref:polyprenyl diphosphate synthase n=1 Tax=unclassified Lentzea TaxID=2643253 RepID=UPI0033D90FC8
MKIIRDVLQDLYTRRLRRQLRHAPLPRHVGMIMDGNRRWARQEGLANASLGHQHGAEHVQDVMAWCEDIGVHHMTVYLASADNLHKRDDDETRFLLDVIERIVVRRAVESDRWQVHVAGRLDLLPDSTRNALKLAVEDTRDRAAEFHLTMAVGYDGRHELVDAVRSLLDDKATTGTSLEELASSLTADDISRHLHGTGRPDPDLVIRTSGEVRMSGFLLWQAAYAELYFCDVHWPGFRHLDFLRALRSYAARHRRRAA